MRAFAAKAGPVHGRVPDVTFKTRAKNAKGEFEWKDVTTKDLFGGKKVVLFSLPGAFTPTCSSTHLPRFEMLYNEFKELGVDEIYCLSVNDTFTMNAWRDAQHVEHVKVIPDGNGQFTRQMGMLVAKENLGFGARSWRYSALVDDGEIKQIFVEPGYADNAAGDPFEVSDADTMLKFLKENK